ncbi:arylalkylamine N-acetyltransferase 1-like isoform X2 [Harmonia axyridis]|uniref:arylalkylamine N-acetyltransferase 1-like isoform X2 n=1 Tax=Harmonia axyridis TaxID=115357 RepID=UPI001E275E3C|nr:arylalkylamine N-acetyltransferase 1-like isoform X2 [Harmonia axyridis]
MISHHDGVRSMSQDSTDGDIEIKLVEDEDKDDVIDLARRFFNRDEPLNEYIGLTGTDGKCPDLEAYILSTLEEGTSVKAVSNGKLVAFSMNGVVSRHEPNEKSCVDSEKFQLILDFLLYNTVQCDIFGKYPDIEKAMTVKIISVDPCMRGRGVATRLVDETRKIAIEKGCKLMYVECTSYFSAQIMKRLGFEKVYSLKYSDYKIDDKIVFDPKKPHEEYTVYVQKLEN